MAKLMKFSFYLLVEDNLTVDDAAEELDYPSMYQLHVEESKEFDHTKEEYLADRNCDMALLEQHFEHSSIGANYKEYPWELKPGMFLRHFKGKIVEFSAVAANTEHPSEYNAIYRDCSTGKIWSRPIQMFCSLVDVQKYPDCKQIYRFEPMEGVPFE